MTHEEQIIKDAVEGGFGSVSESSYGPHHYADLFLDRSFWQAVGKTRGWGEWEEKKFNGRKVRIHSARFSNNWEHKSLNFFISVMEGDDYETALSKLN